MPRAPLSVPHAERRLDRDFAEYLRRVAHVSDRWRIDRRPVPGVLLDPPGAGRVRGVPGLAAALVPVREPSLQAALRVRVRTAMGHDRMPLSERIAGQPLERLLAAVTREMLRPLAHAPEVSVRVAVDRSVVRVRRLTVRRV